MAQQTPVEALRDFLEPVITQMDPDEGIEDQFKVQPDITYQAGPGLCPKFCCPERL